MDQFSSQKKEGTNQTVLSHECMSVYGMRPTMRTCFRLVRAHEERERSETAIEANRRHMGQRVIRRTGGVRVYV
jgi:hypothetical protein